MTDVTAEEITLRCDVSVVSSPVRTRKRGSDRCSDVSIDRAQIVKSSPTKTRTRRIDQRSDVRNPPRLHVDAAQEIPDDSEERALVVIERDQIKGFSLPSGTISERIDDLRELQRRRTFFVRLQTRITNATLAIARRQLGWQLSLPEAERSKITKLAPKIVEAARKQQTVAGYETAVMRVALDIMPLDSAIAQLLVQRAGIEREMRAIARSLPIWQWASGVSGAGELGIAVLIGETGNISLYSSHQKLWKRLGLAVINGERQRRKSDPDDAAAHGYNPKRRAEIWSCIGDPMFRAQSASVDKATSEVTRPAGPYRKIYDAAKQRFIDEGKSTRPAHAHAHGLRIMTKAFVKHIWQEWHEMERDLAE